MSHQIINNLGKKYIKKILPLNSGQTVRVHQKVIEGSKERIQIFEGLIIAKKGTGVSSTITVRKIVDGIGVERIFAIHSTKIVKIEIKKIAKVRRSKLYYMRERSGKSARLNEIHVSKKELQEMEKKAKEKEKIKSGKAKTEVKKSDSKNISKEHKAKTEEDSTEKPEEEKKEVKKPEEEKKEVKKPEEEKKEVKKTEEEKDEKDTEKEKADK